MSPQLNTPVTFIIFNRPDVTALSFQAIAKAKPKRLLIVADGPRPHVIGERDKCLKTRAVVEKIDWDCEVIREYSETNLGCKKRVSSGLDKAFSIYDETIVVEDDCLPNESFFSFCHEMLERYRVNMEVMLISGNNFHPSVQTGSSYLFSHFPHIWGWATWKRVWKDYDVSMKDWPELKGQGFPLEIIKTRTLFRKWVRTFDRTFAGEIDTWDHQLTFAIWKKDGLCISPMRNLVKNIGFGPEATHTKALNDYANRPSEELVFPLRHPPRIEANKEFENLTRRSESLFSKIISRLKGYILSN